MSVQIWYQHKVRVRYQETDQMGVVYHANYLNWFEIGRTEMIRALGFPYRQLEELGLLLPVVEAQLKYKLPARYDDILGIYTRVATLSPIRLRIEAEIRKLGDEVLKESESIGLTARRVDHTDGELLVSGYTEHVWVDSNWKPARIDKQAPALYNGIKQQFSL